MNRMLILLLAVFYLLSQAGPAEAAIIGTISTWFAGLSVGAQFAIRLVVSLGSSLLMQKKPKFAAEQGVEIKYTTSGGTEPQGTVFGISDSGGHSVYRNSHGPENRYYTHVIEYSDVPGCALVGLIIDGVQSEFGETEHPDYGRPILSKRLEGGTDRAWVKFYDGTQTAADPMMVDRYSEHPDLPWTADHVGTGIGYAIYTFDYDREQFVSEPQIRPILSGVAFYDPREDTSVGGDGAQRFDDPDTWVHSKNPLVIAGHVLRGYVLPCGEVYGGAADAEDLPLANWVAAMNACDAPVGASDRPRFRFGMEVKFHRDEPAKVIEECLAAANAQIAELGGVFTVQVAEPAPAVAAITDGDILVSEPTEYDPFPGFEQVFNALVLTHPDPGSLWQPKQMKVIENAAWVAEDGERRSISVELMGVPWPGQAQQVGDSMLRDERRWKRHKAPLRHSWGWLEPLQTIEWTSAWNGYDAKLFEVAECIYDLRRGNVLVSLRERDPADLAHIEALELPDPPVATLQLPRADAEVVGFAVVADSVQSDDGIRQRPILRASWNRVAMGDIEGVGMRLRIKDSLPIVRQIEVRDRDAASHVIEPVLPGETYQVSARVLSQTHTHPWGAWIDVLTDDLRLTPADLTDAFKEQIDTAFNRTDGAVEAVDGAIGDLRDRIEGWLGGIGLGGGTAPLKPLDRTVALEIPRIRSVQDAAIEAEDAAILNAIENFGLRRRLTDAGVYTNPETGRVEIRAIDAIAGRQSNVEIAVDALESQVSLKATFAYVDQAVSNAVLDPSQIPVLEDIEAQISDAEILLDAQEGQITLLTNSLTVEDEIVTMGSVTQRLNSVEGSWSLTLTQQTFEELQTTANEVSIELETLDKPGIAFSVSTSRALRDQSGLDDDARVIDMIRSWQDAQGAREVAASARRNLTAFIDDNNNAIAQEVAELAAIGQATSAQLRQESTVRAEADAATVEQLSELEARVDDPNTGLAAAIGQINDLNTLDVTSDSALVVDYLSLKGQVNDPDTGLPVAIGEIEQLNNVDVSSTSALVQAHRSLAAEVNTPGTGLKARLDDLDEIVVNEDGIRGIFGQELTGSLAPNGELRDEIDTAADNAVDAAVGRVATFDIDSTSALALFRDKAAAALDDGEGNILGANVLSGAIASVEDNEQGLSALAGRADVIETSLGAANLIPNGRVDTGDFAGWVTVPATFSIGVRGSGPGVMNLSPTPFAVRIAANAATQAAVAADVPASAGDVLRLSARSVVVGGGSATLRLQVVFRDADGTNLIISAKSFTPTATWQLVQSDPIIAPVGTASARIRLLRDAGGSGDAFVTDFRAERDAAGVVDVAARVATIEGAYVTAEGALAFVTQSISADYADFEALAEATAFAEATLGGIAEGFVWSLGGDDVLSLVRVDDGVTEPVITARIRGDFIRLDGDTEVDGDFRVSGSLVVEGTVDTAQFAQFAAGAQKHAQRTGSLDITSTSVASPQVFISSVVINTFIEQAAGGGRVVMHLTGKCAKLVAAGDVTLYFLLQRLTGGTWQTIDLDPAFAQRHFIPAAYGTNENVFTYSFTSEFISSGTYRMACYVDNSDGVRLDSIAMYFEQMRKVS